MASFYLEMYIYVWYYIYVIPIEEFTKTEVIGLLLL